MSGVTPGTDQTGRIAEVSTFQAASGPVGVAILDLNAAFVSDFLPVLEGEGFLPEVFAGADGLLRALSEKAFSIVIMDLNLGKENGNDVLGRLRRVSNILCVVISDASSELDRVLALELGADLYLSKDLTGRELLAHIRALLRRNRVMAASVASPGGWQMLPEQRDLLRPGGVPCRLTSAEYKILQFMAGAIGQPVSRDSICQSIFGRPYRFGDRTVDVLITRLRRKIETHPEKPKMIKTIHAVGYCFVGFLPSGEEE